MSMMRLALLQRVRSLIQKRREGGVMHRSTLTTILLSAILLCAKDSMATDVDAHAIVEICLLPHQTGICDVIFTGTVADGTVVSNDDECVAGFTVDDVLWGHVNSSNITVRSIARNYMPNARPFGFVSGERYLANERLSVYRAIPSAFLLRNRVWRRIIFSANGAKGVWSNGNQGCDTRCRRRRLLGRGS